MNYKKYLPLVIVVIVITIIFVGAVFIIRKINQPITENTQQSDQSVPDLPQNERPLTELLPSSDGHYVSLKVNGINIPGAASMDYELLYKANNGVTVTTEGVPGTIQLNGQTGISRDNILLGSASSGKVRYDKDVQNGKLTLRFRDTNGKLLGKVATDWHLQTGSLTLSSVDGSFKYTLNNSADGVWFITMQSFGTPKASDVVVFSNGWAIFASDGLAHTGTVSS